MENLLHSTGEILPQVHSERFEY